MKTIRDIKQQSLDNLPRHWAQQWLLQVLNKPAVFLLTDDQYVLTSQELEAFNKGIAKMQAGTPLAYLTGKQDFWSLQFLVNEHTLIPRPDTEVLVEHVLNWVANPHNQDQCNENINSLSKKKDTRSESAQKPCLQLLDLGTGSGCIAISLAYELQRHYPNRWQVTAIDDSKPALEVAQRNAQLNHVCNIKFTQSDWFSALQPDDKYEVIVSNPPYIDDRDEHLNSLKAEPLSALVAPDNGLADIKMIVSQSKAFLVNGGLLAIEHGYDQGNAVRQLFNSQGYTQVHTVQDYGGNDRVTMGVWESVRV